MEMPIHPDSISFVLLSLVSLNWNPPKKKPKKSTLDLVGSRLVQSGHNGLDSITETKIIVLYELGCFLADVALQNR